MPKGYFFAEIEITDPTEYDTYRSQTMATLQKCGGGYIVRGGAPVLVEGNDQPGRIVVASGAEVVQLTRIPSHLAS
jgi:uncharacterized protein (DUF1330 family)